MSVRVLAFFDSRYQSTPDVARLWGDAPWRAVTEAKPQSRLHFALDQPAPLGAYDLANPEAAAMVVGLARKAGIDGFVVDLQWSGEGYVTGAQVLAPLTDDSFGLAFHWRNGLDAFWSAPALRSLRSDRARALVAALKVGVPASADGRIPLIIERPKDLSAAKEVLTMLRAAAAAEGLSLNILAARAEDMDGAYLAQGYDALVDPGPADWQSCRPDNEPSGLNWLEVQAGLRDSVEYLDRFYSYTLFVVARMINRAQRGPVHPRVFPAFHNWTAFPQGGAMHLLNQRHGANVPTDTYLYGLFLENALIWSFGNFPQDQGLVFLDSWNGWLEGTQIEPSLFNGDLVFDATRAAIDRARYVVKSREGAPTGSLDEATRERIALLCQAAGRV